MKEPAAIRRLAKRMLMAGSVEAPKKCPLCGQRAMLPAYTSMDVRGMISQVYYGVPVQEALPHWSPEMRETLISGTHPACWKEMFGENSE